MALCCNPATILLVIAVATLLASLTDWLFFDILVHRFYNRAPELWRPASNTRRIVISQAVGTLATAAAVLLAVCMHGMPIRLALLVWAAGALPVSVQNWQWMRLHLAIAVSHATGWLIRLLVGTTLAGLLIH